VDCRRKSPDGPTPAVGGDPSSRDVPMTLHAAERERHVGERRGIEVATLCGVNQILRSM
jgi:hypothetical protein